MSAEVKEQPISNPVIDHLDLWGSVYVKKATTGRGSNGKNSPYGIRKLRELILELAVRGQLVPQDPNDEPANVLLERISRTKAGLVKEGKLKKQKKLPIVGDELHALPAGWDWARLGNITSYGVTEKAEPGEVESETWVVELEDVEKVTSKLLQRIRYSERAFRSSKNRFEVGDVLYGKLRPYLDKVLVADESGVCTTEIMPVRSYAGFHSEYLRLLLKAPSFIAYADESTHGMNLPRLGTDKARLAIVPIAPLAEQHRIVAKVDELMALCDQLEQQQTDSLQVHQTLVETLLRTLLDDVQDAQVSREAGMPGATAGGAESTQQAWNRIAENFDTLFTTEESIDQLKQTILQLAVMGRLVPQDPNDEPASVLLEKIAAEKEQLIKEGKIKKQKKLPELTEVEKLVELPAGWQLARFGDVLVNRDAERIPLSVADRRTRQGEYDYYGASGVIDSIDDYLFDKPLLLIGEDGANLINRSTPIAFMARGKYWVNNHAHVLDGISEGLLEFVCRYINAISLEPYVTGTAQPKMNQAKMNSIVLRVPPLDEQHRIVTKVDELMALCESLKTGIQDARSTQVHLADAVVEQAVA